MKCDIFSNQVTKGEKGRIDKVVDLKGRPSTLYERVKEYVKANPQEMSDYDKTYFKELIDNGTLDAENIADLTTDQIALGHYSKVYTPSFAEVYGNWQAESGNEPNFDDVSDSLFGDVLANRIRNQRDMRYDPSFISSTVTPIVEELIGQGVTPEEVAEIAQQEGIYLPPHIIDKAIQIGDMSHAERQRQLAKDIASENFTQEELYHLYKEYGLNKKDLRTITREVKKGKISSTDQVAGISENMDFRGMTEEEKTEAIAKAVTHSTPDIITKLFVEAQEAQEGSTIKDKGKKITDRNSMLRLFRQLNKNNPKYKRNRNVKVLMATLKYIFPTIKGNGMSVTFHTNANSYFNALDDRGLATPKNFNSSAFIAGKGIHIFLESPVLDGTVAVHEILHPIIESLAASNNFKLWNELKRMAEADTNFIDLYKAVNPNTTENPELEEVINFVAANITESILQKVTGQDKSLSEITTKDINGAMFEETWLEKLLRKMLDMFKAVFGVPINIPTDVNKILTSNHGGLFIKELADNFVNNNRGIDLNITFNSDARFSEAEDPAMSLRKFIGMYRGTEGLELVDNDGNPTSTLVKAAKTLGLSERRLDILLEDMFNSESERIEKSTLLSRLENGILARGDKRRMRTIRAYLTGAVQDILPDETIDDMFRAYIRIKHEHNGKKKYLGPNEMVDDILAAKLPFEVEFYMLSRLLKTYGARQLSGDSRRRVVDKLAEIRKSWGRAGRYMQEDVNNLFGGVEALMHAVKRENDFKTSSTADQNAINDIVKVLKLSKEDLEKMYEQFTEEEIERFFSKVRMSPEEIKTKVVRTGIEVLRRYGVDVSDIIDDTGAAPQRAKGDGRKKGKVNLEDLTDAEINEIIDAHIRVAKGNVVHARMLFENSFPGQESFWRLNDTLKRNANRHAKRYAHQLIDQAIQDVIDGKQATVNHPARFLIKEIIHGAGLKSDLQGRNRTTSEAAKILRIKLAANPETAIRMIEGGVDYIIDLETEDRPGRIEPMKLGKAKRLGFDLIGKLSRREDEENPYDTEKSMGTLVRLMLSEIRTNLEDYYSDSEIGSRKRNELAERFIYRMDLPPEMARELERKIGDYFDAAIAETKKDNITDFLKENGIRGSKMTKLFGLIKAGAFDHETVAEQFPDMFGMKKISPVTISILRRLSNDWRRANTTYRKNILMEKSKMVVKHHNIGFWEAFDSIGNELFYGSALSGFTTLQNVAFGTIGYSTLTRVGQIGGDLMIGLKQKLVDGDDRRWRMLMRSIAIAFEGWNDREKLAATKDKLRDIYLSDMGDLKAHELERDIRQETSPNILGGYLGHIANERLQAIRTMLKGSPSDILEGAKMLLESWFMGDDLGSDVLNERFSSIGRRGIRLGTTLFPWLVLGGVTMMGFGTPAVIGILVPTLVAPVIFSKSILAMDYLFKSNIERNSMARNAYFELKKEEQSGSYNPVDNDAFFEEFERRLGRDPQSKREKEEIVQDELEYALDRESNRIKEEEGRLMTSKEKEKFRKRYRRRRMLELQSEFVRTDIQEAARRQANTETLTGLPEGVPGRVISSMNRYLTEDWQKEKKTLFGKGFRVVRSMLKAIAKLAFIPFANVAGHMANNLYDSVAIWNLNKVGKGYKWDSATRTYEEVDYSPNEVNDRWTRKAAGAIGAVLFFSIAYRNFPPDDDDEEETLGLGAISTEFKSLGNRYRITGPGPLSYTEQVIRNGYKANKLQIYDEDLNRWRSVMDVPNYPYYGAFFAPLGEMTDRAIFNAGNMDQRGRVGEGPKPLSVFDMIKSFVAYGTGQGFNQSAQTLLSVTSLAFGGKDMEDYEKDKILNDFVNSLARPAQAIMNPSLMRQTYNAMKDRENQLEKKFQDKIGLDDTWQRIRAGFYGDNPYLEPTLSDNHLMTDAMGYPIASEYGLNPEGQAIVHALDKIIPEKWLPVERGGDKRYGTEMPDSKFYKFADQDVRIPRPKGRGTTGTWTTDGEEVFANFPSAVPNTIYEVSKRYRRELFDGEGQNTIEFRKIMQRLYDGTIGQSDVTVGVGKEMFSTYVGDDPSRFINTINAEDERPFRIHVIKSIIEKRSRQATDIAKYQVMSRLMEKNLPEEFRDDLRFNPDAPEKNKWSDMADWMSEKGLRIMVGEDNKIQINFIRNAATTEGRSERVYKTVDAETLHDQLREIIRNTPVLDKSVYRAN